MTRPGQAEAGRGGMAMASDGTGAGADDPVAYLELATLPSAPFWARRQAGAALNAWQLAPEVIETTQLVVSELVTNAVKTANPKVAALADTGIEAVEIIGLTLRFLPGRIIVEVFDNDLERPMLADADSDSEDGRGLLLVQALTKEWGYFFPPAGGKTVYAVIPAESPPIFQPSAAEDVR